MRHLSIPRHATPAGRPTILLDLRETKLNKRPFIRYPNIARVLTICFSSLMLVPISHSKSS